MAFEAVVRPSVLDSGRSWQAVRVRSGHQWEEAWLCRWRTDWRPSWPVMRWLCWRLVVWWRLADLQTSLRPPAQHLRLYTQRTEKRARLPDDAPLTAHEAVQPSMLPNAPLKVRHARIAGCMAKGLVRYPLAWQTAHTGDAYSKTACVVNASALKV